MATTRIMPLHIGKGRTESKAISDIIDYDTAALVAMELGIRSIKQRHNQLELMFYPDTPISMPALMAYVQSYKNITIGNQSGELAVKLTLLKERLTATYVDSIKERLKGMQKIAVVD